MRPTTTPPTRASAGAATVDVYPSASGAAFTYCPAGAASGDPDIDDPVTFFAAPEFDGWFPDGVPDHSDQDRLYITQKLTPYPYLRADG